VLLFLLLLDGAMVALSLAALFFAVRERRRVVKHWHLLLPGLFAVAASVLIVAFPRVSDLWEPQRLIIAMLAFLIGAARGRFMKLASDRVYKVAALHNPVDSTVLAAVQAVFAMLDMALDFKASGLTPYTSPIELIQIVAAAYLLGRSITLFTHVRTSTHIDLIAR
jgi:hypothetical protein